MNFDYILQFVPHQPPFRFIDKIEQADENGLTGSYTFKTDEYFYRGHYPQQPVTPGFMVGECMVQIGLVAFGIYLLQQENKNNQFIPVLTDAQLDFLKPVYPGDKLIVTSAKIYFRFHKLRCNIAAINQHGEMVCTGICSGMLVNL
jgi:3-hydroxyacyl-[acyl-carrier-protein] dehydratase